VLSESRSLLPRSAYRLFRNSNRAAFCACGPTVLQHSAQKRMSVLWRCGVRRVGQSWLWRLLHCLARSCKEDSRARWLWTRFMQTTLDVLALAVSKSGESRNSESQVGFLPIQGRCVRALQQRPVASPSQHSSTPARHIDAFPTPHLRRASKFYGNGSQNREDRA
jgi:hypothetical protein